MSYAVYPSLEDQVVLVTGGASGIGAEIVRAFAINKTKVAFLDIQVAPAEALVKELGSSTHTPLFLECDLSSVSKLQAAIVSVREQLGPIGVLVNNVGNDTRHSIDEVTEEYWDNNHNINLKPQFFAAQAVYPDMQKLGGGSIINLSSIAWRGGSENMVAYTTAKAAVMGMSRSLAKAFGVGNVRVNSIEPGAVLTPRQRELWYKDDAQVEAIAQRQCIKRTLFPQEIARLALFLGSDQSEMLTKQSIIVDAGIY